MQIWKTQMSANLVLIMSYRLFFILICVYLSAAKPSKYLLNEDIGQAADIATMLLSHQYDGKKSELPNANTAVVAQDSDDDTVIVSKLSDTEIISLLKKKQKQDLLDVTDTEPIRKSKKKAKNLKDKKPRAHNQNLDRGSAFFRIDDKEVEPYNVKVGVDPNYLANQRIKNLLHSVPLQNLVDISSEETEENKELLFDILTAQLKKLCCKSSKTKKTKQKKVNLPSYEPLLSISDSHDNNQSTGIMKHEQMFLIINDEIQDEQASDIIYVDPDSLSPNSSVVLLGPITTPLSDPQLNLVMSRITLELSKPEYIPLLKELSEGKIKKNNTRLMKSLVSGSNTRRYIKPHRCNQRYPLAEGPKWLVCTGYLNINTPSIYD
ncbi:uncharacterized protein LOC125240820 [Leguminivora glycinivorella]|uniref:uncharacterized protein LOC125240820 n=1 Tax=Leguminivora glycinivorella TaxID=1035111 RepID=UPI00200C1CDF|nr:uncharacterized protein LOC125240820 [Leguminivora glycinivorella]